MKLTKSRIDALEAVVNGKVWGEEMKDAFILHAPGVRARTISELEGLGLIEKKRTSRRINGFEWQYSLTEVGSRVLEETGQC